MKPAVVVDTNVALVANDKAPQAGIDCVVACTEALIKLRDGHRVLVDDHNLIFDEYRRRLSPSGQPGLGDAFFKWLWDNQGNPDHCRQVPVTPRRDRRGFDEFPDDASLEGFDPGDRKFVAVAVASGERPPILNASDTDWWHHREALERHGAIVHFLCPDLMNRNS